MMLSKNKAIPPRVTPFAGVWIEIFLVSAVLTPVMSLPSRECGLKSPNRHLNPDLILVTPFAGVWIEIPIKLSGQIGDFVTPFAGVWIEIL